MMNKNPRCLIFFEGIVLAILGIFAISQPFVATLSVEFFLGLLLVVAGLVQVIRAIINRLDPWMWSTLIGGVLALVAGGLLLAYPVHGVLTLTFLITVFLILDGIAKITASWQYRPIEGWGWLLFSGVLSLILASLIYSGWPTTAGWVIGLYVGIYLLFLGISLITLSCCLKKRQP